MVYYIFNWYILFLLIKLYIILVIVTLLYYIGISHLFFKHFTQDGQVNSKKINFC